MVAKLFWQENGGRAYTFPEDEIAILPPQKHKRSTRKYHPKDDNCLLKNICGKEKLFCFLNLPRNAQMFQEFYVEVLGCSELRNILN